MSELRTKLVDIQTEKNTKLTPENLREGITCLGVTGILKEGLDTSDATAVSNDIAAGKTAYVNGAKIEGILLDRRTEDALWVNTDLDRIDVTSQPSGFLVLAKSIWDEDCVISKETSLDTLVHYSDLANAIGLTSDQIQAGNTVLGIEGTAPVTFATVEEMNNNTVYPENTFAIVYGTEYVGTYKLDGGVWTQVGEATDNSEMMKILNETDGDILEYEGNGGTDEEINAVLEDILTNPNTEIEDGPGLGEDEDATDWV